MTKLKETYRTKTDDGRMVIGFKGFEVVEQRDGSYNLLALRNHAADNNGVIQTAHKAV